MGIVCFYLIMRLTELVGSWLYSLLIILKGIGQFYLIQSYIHFAAFCPLFGVGFICPIVHCPTIRDTTYRTYLLFQGRLLHIRHIQFVLYYRVMLYVFEFTIWNSMNSINLHHVGLILMSNALSISSRLPLKITTNNANQKAILNSQQLNN